MLRTKIIRHPALYKYLTKLAYFDFIITYRYTKEPQKKLKTAESYVTLN